MEREKVQDPVADAFTTIEQAAQVGPDKLAIRGGVFDAAQLSNFMQVWDQFAALHMPWRMVEYVSEFVVHTAGSSAARSLQDYESLERARLFGSGGDLDLRRAGNRILWRFIGARELSGLLQALDPFLEQESDYWAQFAAGSEPWLRQIETHTVQWRPNEDRVRGAWLQYGGAVVDGQKPVKLYQKQFYDQGALTFVWLTGLEAYDAPSNAEEKDE